MPCLKFKKRAKKYLDALQPVGTRNQIEAMIDELQVSPEKHPLMAGSDSKRKFRRGVFRVCYEYDEDEDVVVIREIGPRGQIYKQEQRRK